MHDCGGILRRSPHDVGSGGCETPRRAGAAGSGLRRLHREAASAGRAGRHEKPWTREPVVKPGFDTREDSSSAPSNSTAPEERVEAQSKADECSGRVV